MTKDLQILNEIEKAAQLCEKNYSHEEIIDVMKTENDFEKQICILKLDCLKNQEEAELLVFQLTEHHGLIREATAIKINEFILDSKYTQLFLTDYILESLLKGINDINPNICRMLCAVLPTLFTGATEKKSFFLNKLYSRFFVVFEELEKLKRSTWYTKKLFNLYWCLEALCAIEPNICENFEKVIETSANIRDYTIREKAAMVLAMTKDSSPQIDEIKNKLKNDENFYVRRYSQNF